ncbi:hypothetical protein [Leadbettera azotonutricia]|uniref:Uncharacterized protein n=1 Tax=Leadbettera azotonutricia (strain ATCC BAA-888 / DSM 13862 / ZAS-9) TaxID=545695 RepID=F5YDR7_LEAAZ|nr:hypothetical protein [Leadbettera azotonutricia]AEF80603.1 hypothetical protein TREAZ_2697 [Leadbettera azotonutricia ZAS-9]
MQPIDHFNSRLAKSESSVRSGQGLGKKDADFLEGEFVSLIAPILGKGEAGDLFRRTLERCQGSSLVKIGAVAAFLLGEKGDDSVLDAGDWEDIKETLEDLAGEMDLDTLTTLMGELLVRGKI